MADDVVVEDPIGEAVTNPDGTGVRGKEAVAAFYDAHIGPNTLTVTCEESFPSSSPTEIAYILVLHTYGMLPSQWQSAALVTRV